MRHLLFVAVLLSVWGVRAQDPPTINTDLPTIIPPSPTVASLMKFEEIPVNHYTGVPDITIPIFSSKTRSKDISVSVSLKYHPSDIQVANVASWTGLGWSLFAGGTISRTVRGEVDQNLVGGNGIYSNQNPFLSLFYNQQGEFVYGDTSYARQEFLWNNNVKGMHDTQHDLYQFSFQGYSGRFTLSKNGEVRKLYNDAAVQIIYNSSNDSFTAYDDKGYRYVFDSREISSDFKTSYNLLRDGTETNPVHPQNPPYTSSYHLSSIYDNNNNLVVSFSYETVLEIYDRKLDSYYFLNNYDEPELLYIISQSACAEPTNIRNMPPRITSITNQISTQTKKLESIFIEGVGRIYFESESGRQDMNPEGKRLKKITIKDWNDNEVKSFELFHSYEGTGKRLVLNKISELALGSSDSLDTKFFYDNIQLLPNKDSGKRDEWGYFNNTDFLNSPLSRKTHSVFCKTGVLQKIELPTGGAFVFNFGPNTFSYISDQPLTVFDNEHNRVSRSFMEPYVGYTSEGSSDYRWFSITEDQAVNFVIETLNNPLPVDRKKGWYFSIIPIILPNPPMINYISSYQVDPNRLTRVIRLEDLDPNLTTNYFTTVLDLKAGPYVVRFYKSDEGLPQSVEYEFNTSYYDLSDEYKFEYGGGLRINNVGYFTDGTVSKDYYRHIVQYPQIPHLTPEFEKKFDYSFFNDPNKSSGALSFPKPVYSYLIGKSHLMFCFNLYYLFPVFPDVLEYKVINDYNNLSPMKTHGADVGYKNVTITTNRREFNEVEGPLGTEYYPIDHDIAGREELTFTSSIDEPETYYDTQYPFTPSPNNDHRRGLLIKSEMFDSENRLLNTSTMSYDILEEEVITGIMTYTLQDCGFNRFWSTFSGYYSVASDINCDPNYDATCNYHCGYPIFHMINFRPVKEAYGWSRLSEKITRDYFYEGMASSEVQTRETFSYDPVNKKIISHTAQTDNSSVNPQILKTDYFYHNGNSSYSQNRMAEIEEIQTYRNGELLYKSRIQYANTFSGNASWLPQTFLAAKGSQAHESKVHYVRYDEYGNPVEVMQEEGTPIVYIWGYYKTQPIAKIDNATWTQVQSYVANLQSLSDTGTETALITALDNLRMVLPNAMVTTMTYKPLVGVSTITDPVGYRMKYIYDSFNRLKEVRDMDNNLVTEHEYRYRD